MVKTVINNKGVVARTGTGTKIENDLNISGATTIGGAATVTGQGLTGCAYSAESAITGTGATNTDLEVTIPAGAVILDVGVVFTEADVINSNANLSVTVGFSAGDNAICTATNMISANTAAALGSAISVSGANGEGAAALAFVANAPLRVAAEDVIFFRVANSANNVTAGKAVAFVRYMVVS
jgi:hypothetical protein